MRGTRAPRTAHELDRLDATLDSATASQGSAELAIIYLFEHYDFDLDALMAGLRGMQFGSMLWYANV